MKTGASLTLCNSSRTTYIHEKWEQKRLIRMDLISEAVQVVLSPNVWSGVGKIVNRSLQPILQLLFILQLGPCSTYVPNKAWWGLSTAARATKKSSSQCWICLNNMKKWQMQTSICNRFTFNKCYIPLMYDVCETVSLSDTIADTQMWKLQIGRMAKPDFFCFFAALPRWGSKCRL